jgi:hypothetical protein
MTSPFTIIALHAFDSYHKSIATAYPQHTLPKALLYTVGTTILATVIYKSIKHTTTQNNASSSSSNFLSKFLKPFHELFNQRIVEIDRTQEETPFEDKYFKEYDEWVLQQSKSEPNNNDDAINTVVTDVNIVEQNHKKECLEAMYYSTIRETINDFYGDVIMCYDHQTFSFAYYARTANIPYKYLETISRKYMIETNAPREIHVDIRNEYKKAKDRTVQQPRPTPVPISTSSVGAEGSVPEQNQVPVQTLEKDVFVKLKSYNTASNLNLHTTTNDTTDKTHKFATTSSENATNTTSTFTNKIIREKANRFSYRGKINDFSENHRRTTSETEAATATAPIEVKGYAEFKKQMTQTRSAL